MKSVRYFWEGQVVKSFVLLFSLLPLDAASGLGGFLARTVGPRLAASRKARRNLALSLPGKTDAEYAAILRGMWDNLGRTFAEYPHLRRIAFERVVSTGDRHLADALASGRSSILFTGHLANWETAAVYAYKLGMYLDLIYRAPNNPHVDGVLHECRSLGGEIKTYPKSSQGMRDVFAALKAGRHIGILIDQKYNQGLPMPFFGRTAMTSPAFAQLAQRFDVPLIPARVERLKGAHFRITICDPIPTRDRALEDVIRDSHTLLEEWITERPDQWLWLHNRWREK